MNKKTYLKGLKGLVLALLITAVLAGPSFAIEYWIWAGRTTVTMPDATVIPVWGYALDTVGPSGDFTVLDGTVTVPGPMLTVPVGDSTLIVHLFNNLPTLGGNPVPTSIVIPGQPPSVGMTPVWDNGTSGPRPGPTARVRSFTSEAPAGGSATYTWNNVQPGTYIYHSGTHPALQVQMGLYGGVTKDAATGQAYPGIAYDREETLFYSEIDPALHTAVDTNNYGPGTGMTSTTNYVPKYFLINGQPYPANTPIPRVIKNRTTLLRLFNAGIKSHVPMLNGLYMTIVAEDGKPYLHAREQYTVHLDALKTKDVLIVSPTKLGKYPLVDRRLNLTNNTAPDGGMLTTLDVVEVDKIGLFRPTIKFWLLDINGNGIWDAGPGADKAIQFGILNGDLPIPGDWNGDGKTEVGIYRPSKNLFLRDVNGNGIWDPGPGSDKELQFGIFLTDIPIVGDWNGDGKTEIGLYRSSVGAFLLDVNGNGFWDPVVADKYYVFDTFIAGDVPIAGDWNGDGTTEIGLFRASTKSFLLDMNGNGIWDPGPGPSADKSIVFSLYVTGDSPITGDWNGDGTTNIGLYRPSINSFLLDKNGNGIWDPGPAGDIQIVFGVLSTDLPVIGKW